MDGGAAVLRDESGGRFGEGEIRSVLAVRRVVGQPGLTGCISCADIFGVQLEWRGFACGSWSAFAGAGGAAAWIQEREVSTSGEFCGFDEECGGWARVVGACGGIFLVCGDLNCRG